MKQRETYPDLIKGIAILLTIIGHNIQFGLGGGYYNQELYFNNPLFKTIYSFHMPLFMLVSGYFFFNTIRKYRFYEIIKNRIIMLFIPISVWALFPWTLKIIKGVINRVDFNSNILRWYFTIMLNNLWFLWAVIVCSVIVLAVNYFFKDSIIIYIALLLIMLFLPDFLNSHLYKYMYPYYVTGYLWNKYRKKKFSNCIGFRISIIMLILLYAILYYFFSYDSYIYTSGIFILKGNWVYQLLTDTYRWLIGYVGSAIILAAGYLIKDYKFAVVNALRYMGKRSLGIYIISDFIYANCMLRLISHDRLCWYWAVFETAIVLVVCVIGCEIIDRYKLLRILFLGRR